MECLNRHLSPEETMSTDSTNNTRDISVLQLLTKLVKETDRLVRLADDIDTHASTPQAKAAFNLIGSEVSSILSIMKSSLDPLYRLYDLDPGMKNLDRNRRNATIKEFTIANDPDDSYDEQALWNDIKAKE
ncbi:MAG: hypothetical protein QG574_820 [Cyanobacteriota bacterium erpe_2018_sw_21hr_WHONDRS-SW48-000092_B_bin.40]|jgi:hypothetical protein|nr:hypothetical protein [Cyanobacteriota bacterium erpe_2018_sw_21hr_WHONDRS-SW48-000092_B_bin.40]